jgi:hypothetical protein
VHGNSTFDGVVAEASSGAGAEHGLVVVAASFLQPDLHNSGGRGGEGDAALLAAFANALNVSAGADTIPELHTFARGIRQDYPAVRNGLSLPYSSGACEGNVNRLKFLKRQMFGRANTDLLRNRVLLCP